MTVLSKFWPMGKGRLIIYFATTLLYLNNPYHIPLIVTGSVTLQSAEDFHTYGGAVVYNNGLLNLRSGSPNTDTSAGLFMIPFKPLDAFEGTLSFLLLSIVRLQQFYLFANPAGTISDFLYT